MKKILLIDNDKVTSKLVQKFLSNYKYEVDWAPSAKLALSKLDDPSYDLIISEVEMTGLNGFDILRLMKKCFIEKPLVFFSSKDDSTTRLEALMGGALDLISKKRDFINLPHRVGKIMQNIEVHVD
ncbi:MAG: response regulator [Flavobacteriales bacterium]|nr:response regulator [Flavobacteriales bacterium]